MAVLVCSGAATVSDVFWMRVFEVQLVGQEGQAPPGGFVSNLVHHILQGVDVLPNVLQRKPQTVFTVETDPLSGNNAPSSGPRHRKPFLSLGEVKFTLTGQPRN